METEEKPFKIRINDLNEGCFLEVNPSTTITDIKRMCEENGINGEFLTKNGIVLENQQSLADLAIATPGEILVSRLALTVRDLLVDSETRVVLSGADTLASAIETYFEKSGRAQRKKYTLSFREMPLAENAPVGTLGPQGVENESTVFFQAAPFVISVQDVAKKHFQSFQPNSPGVFPLEGASSVLQVVVEDNWNADRVKEELSRACGRDFDESFFLSKKGRRLLENVQLFKYSLAENDLLEFAQDRAAIACEYVCGECGKQNWLKKRDPVGCKACSGKILYKVRKRGALVYNAI